MNLAIWKRLLHTRHAVPLSVSIFLQGLLMAVVLPLLSVVLTDSIGMTKETLTAFLIANTLVGIVVALGSGYLSDGLVARYKLALFGGVLGVISYVGIGLARTPEHAFIAGVTGVGMGILFPQLFAVAKSGVLASWSREDQVVGITALRTLFSFGFIFGTALSSVLAKAIDLQLIFLVAAAGMLALTLYAAYVLFIIERAISDSAASATTETDSATAPAREVSLPVWSLIVPLLALVVLRGADSTRGAYLSLVMNQMFNDPSIGPTMFGITAAAELITMSMIGTFASRTSEKTAIAVSALTGALYFVILSFSQSLPVLYAAHILYAIFVAALLGVAMAYVQSLIANRAGLGGSIYMAVLNVGSLVGILSPLMVEGYDQKIFVVPAILCVAGAAMLMLGDRTSQLKARLEAEMTESLAGSPNLIPDEPVVQGAD